MESIELNWIEFDCMAEYSALCCCYRFNVFFHSVLCAFFKIFDCSLTEESHFTHSFMRTLNSGAKNGNELNLHMCLCMNVNLLWVKSSCVHRTFLRVEFYSYILECYKKCWFSGLSDWQTLRIFSYCCCCLCMFEIFYIASKWKRAYLSGGSFAM